MSDDLISRKALINAIHNFVEQHRNDDEIQWTGCDWMLKEDSAIDIINRQPTAYDIDKVMERLEELNKTEQSRAAEYDEAGRLDMMDIHDVKAEAYRNSKRIVKSGGIE